MTKPVALFAAGVAAGLGLLAPSAHADSTAGVDAALFRPAVDHSGVWSLEGARPMPKRDLSWRLWLGFAQKPLSLTVPGIGGATTDGVGDVESDTVIDQVIQFNVAFGFALTQKLTIGFDVAAYRIELGEGYGERGRYDSGGAGLPSTGLQSLRPLSNLDPAGGFEPQQLAGPLDVRLVAKYLVMSNDKLAVAAMVGAGLPFGEDEVFLGDRSFVIEPRLLVDYRLDQVHATKFVFNLGARLRERTVIEAYDPFGTGADSMSLTEDDAQVVLDVGSELIAGAGVNYELSPDIVASAEAVGFIPLPGGLSDAAGLGSCERDDGSSCDDLEDADYYGDAGAGDLAAYAMAGVSYRINPHVTANALGGVGLVGARGDDFRVTAGITWSPQPRDVARIGRGDSDGDGLPDVSDACPEDSEDRDGYQDDDGCPDVDNDGDGVVDANDSCADEPEDRDAFQDDDGCPERDNDGDSITDVADRCPDSAEDLDQFEDDDGCPEDDNDGDGFADGVDKCPNDPETVNGVDDEDGCPDSRTTTGPEEGTDRINLKGNKIEFKAGTAELTNASKTILRQVGELISKRSLTIRVEVHVPLGTKSKSANAIKKQKAKDRTLAQNRADAIVKFLVAEGVQLQSLQGVGIGSERPLGSNPPTDPLNERVDFIKAQQRNP